MKKGICITPYIITASEVITKEIWKISVIRDLKFWILVKGVLFSNCRSALQQQPADQPKGKYKLLVIQISKLGL